MAAVFPDCGCHYTTDDDGIHFCPMHKAAPDLLAFAERVSGKAKPMRSRPGWDSEVLDTLAREADALIHKAKGQ